MRVDLAVMLLLPVAVEAGELSVAVDGMQSTHGTVMIGLYDSAVGFKRAVAAADSAALLIEPTRYAAVALRATAAAKTTVTFSEVEPGRYAVIVMQDVNNDTKLDRNILGVPTEPYGFSNNVTGFLGAPSFDAAAVTIDDSRQDLEIILIQP